MSSRNGEDEGSPSAKGAADADRFRIRRLLRTVKAGYWAARAASSLSQGCQYLTRNVDGRIDEDCQGVECRRGRGEISGSCSRDVFGPSAVVLPSRGGETLLQSTRSGSMQ